MLNFFTEPEVIDIDEDDDGDPLEVRQPVLPPPVNNNKPGQFTVVSGPRGPVLVSCSIKIICLKQVRGKASSGSF